ncbi:helix-turn-helix domain-containing protein [Escherichia coli]|uniref:helix-turn-helix domain-containing protein n=1 Tax=Escherichia coli TaxID=562 RepID=UPI001D4E30D7|nr:helix-turn-helix transcriptional regulator [Escherichia coli]EGI3994398.1 helix-turn-helix transcriptional regulator [Escherichia coli]EGI4004198.1 helix-turn-helix transcriptional regulator [Escherichia coli]EGI4009280.1 helix-turn-helix transcriptional regulator [Escherichia coli]EGI4023924.1 helix-turn-helix transcriptional regulator [Escherichia coli]EGI4028959.1 helix-turn-helix transcriptional regulator [Escherichia coli]
MKVICDNRYFLFGIIKTIEDVIQKNKINGVKNIIIISSPKTSDIFCFLQFNNINFRCSDTIFYAHPETFDFLRDIIHAPICNIKDLTKNNPLNNTHYIYRVKNSHYKLSLSGRQKEVLLMFLYGLSGKDIANNLGVSIKTVSSYKKSLMDRLYVSNDIQLFYKGILLCR